MSPHINPHTHAYANVHEPTHANAHIIHTLLVMRKNKNIGVYPFLGRTKIRKRSLIIYHDIAYVRGYHFREIEFVFLRSVVKLKLCFPANREF